MSDWLETIYQFFWGRYPRFMACLALTGAACLWILIGVSGWGRKLLFCVVAILTGGLIGLVWQAVGKSEQKVEEHKPENDWDFR